MAPLDYITVSQDGQKYTIVLSASDDDEVVTDLKFTAVYSLTDYDIETSFDFFVTVSDCVVTDLAFSEITTIEATVDAADAVERQFTITQTPDCGSDYLYAFALDDGETSKTIFVDDGSSFVTFDKATKTISVQTTSCDDVGAYTLLMSVTIDGGNSYSEEHPGIGINVNPVCKCNVITVTEIPADETYTMKFAQLQGEVVDVLEM